MLIVYSESPIVKLSRHSVAKQARHVTVTRQHTHSLCLHRPILRDISISGRTSHSISDLSGLLCRKRVGGPMEARDTVMEARGPSDVNTVDTAASQPRYSYKVYR